MIRPALHVALAASLLSLGSASGLAQTAGPTNGTGPTKLLALAVATQKLCQRGDDRACRAEKRIDRALALMIAAETSCLSGVKNDCLIVQQISDELSEAFAQIGGEGGRVAEALEDDGVFSGTDRLNGRDRLNGPDRLGRPDPFDRPDPFAPDAGDATPAR